MSDTSRGIKQNVVSLPFLRTARSARRAALGILTPALAVIVSLCLAPASQTFASETASNTFLQLTELTEAFAMLEDPQTGSVETWNGERIYVRSNSSVTNTDSLLLLPKEGFDSKIDLSGGVTLPSTEGSNPGTFIYNLILVNQESYHKTNLIDPYADLYDGDIRERHGDSFLKALTDGSMCDYGLVVINTHGNEENTHPREDGSWRSYLLVEENYSSEDRELLGTDFAEEYNIPQDQISNYIATGSNNELFISTDYIMKCYEGLTFDNTVFYFGVCGLYRDKAFRDFLLDHGAQAVIGFPYTLRVFVDEGYTATLGRELVKPSGDSPWCTQTIDEVMHATGLNKNAELIDNLPVLQQQTKDELNKHSWIVGMSWQCRSAEFALQGNGTMSGHIVSENGAPVSGALVTAYRFMDQRFEAANVFRTADDGAFEFTHLPWGIYVIDVEAGSWPAVWRTQASVDFGAHAADCGNIYLVTGLRQDAPADTLEAYVMGELAATYGTLDPVLTAFDASYVGESLRDSTIAEAQSMLSGIVSYIITDLDADDTQELLVMRISALPDGFTNALYLEVYEVQPDGSVRQTAQVSYGTLFFASRIHDLRCAVFLVRKPIDDTRVDAPFEFRQFAPDWPGPVICLYTSASMNANFEVVRQLVYTGDSLAVLSEQALVTAEGWCAEYSKEADGTEELVSMVLDYSSEGWALVSQAEVDPTGNTDSMWTDFAAHEAKVIENYCSSLREQGIPRNGKRFSYELRESSDTPNIPVTEAFDTDTNSLTWLAGVDSTLHWTDSAPVKTIHIANYRQTR